MELVDRSQSCACVLIYREQERGSDAGSVALGEHGQEWPIT